MSEHEGCGCCAAKAVDGPRRKIIQIAVAGLVAPGASIAAAAEAAARVLGYGRTITFPRLCPLSTSR